MGSYRLLRVFGIDILVHWSWLAIFALLTWWLSQGFFKDEYGDWTARERWIAAPGSPLALFHPPPPPLARRQAGGPAGEEHHAVHIRRRFRPRRGARYAGAGVPRRHRRSARKL